MAPRATACSSHGTAAPPSAGLRTLAASELERENGKLIYSFDIVVAGKPGVCIVTSGPGATNTITPLATAHERTCAGCR